MKKFTLITVLILLILVGGIGIASAETITGNLSSAPGWDSSNYWITQVIAGTGSFSQLRVKNIEYTADTTAFIHFDEQGQKATYTTAEPYAQTPVTITLGAAEIGTGIIGYQRQYTGFPPTEIQGYQYILFNTWNITGLSEDKILNLTYNTSIVGLGNYPNKGNMNAPGGDVPTGYMGFYWSTAGEYTLAGNYTLNRDISFRNNYNATKPSGIGITGWVNKNELGGSIKYGGRAYILDGVTSSVITSESTVNTNDFYFNVVNPTIKLSIFSSAGNWYNTSQLFTATEPTPTPTPTQPIGPDNPIPAGYIRSMAQCVDGQTSGTIHDSQLGLYDVESTSWSNGSYYGTWWIDTLPGHTINAYGSSTGYTPVSRLNLPASSTHMYELIMWASDIPAAPAGKVTLYVEINDADSGNTITGASITVRDSTGVTQAQTTGTSGTRMFEVANNSLAYITASKYGYLPQTRTITTSVSGTDTVRIQLMRAVVTTAPTNTIPPGGVTTAVTIDPRTNSQKGESAIKILYDNGEAIVTICVIVTIMGLLGIKLGK